METKGRRQGIKKEVIDKEWKADRNKVKSWKSRRKREKK
jgi:hypothetical protein